MASNQTPAPKVVEWHRLSSEAFQQLEKGMPIPHVNGDTTPLQAGFLLGVQFAMSKIKEGFVVG